MKSSHHLVGNLGKYGAALQEPLPSHFKEGAGSARQCRQICCGLWLAQAWEVWCKENLTLGHGLEDVRLCRSVGEQHLFMGLISSSAGSLVML